MKILSIGAVAGLVVLGACSQQPGDPASHSASQAVAESKEGTACADGGARLALTGLCQDTAAKLLLAKTSADPGAPDGCSWQVGETELAGGDALLYRALKCGDNAATVQFAPTEQRGNFELTSSAMEGKLTQPRQIGFLSVIDGDGAGAGAKAVTDLARAALTDKAEAARCAARPAKIEGWPSDALVVDTDPAGSASANGDPVAVCGDLGYFDEATRFWRISQHYAWFFDFGQDLVEIDPASVTVVSQAEGGDWQVQ